MRNLSEIDLVAYNALPGEEARVEHLLRARILPDKIKGILVQDRQVNALMGPVWERRQELLGVDIEEADNIIHAEFPNLSEELKKIRSAA